MKIDKIMLSDHYYLDDQDDCYFWGEYTARQGYSYSSMNQLIYNLKKTLDKRDCDEWRYKEYAIIQTALFFSGAIKSDSKITFVPIPPSKSKDDPLYDDRILRILNTINWAEKDVRELILQKQSYNASHLTDVRLSPKDLANNYVIDERFVNPAPKTIVIFDDVLTTGSHFKAMKQVLSERFKSVKIIGLFVARRVPEADILA
jgi:predicted amidophosphoribosyltransferase